MNNTYFPSLSKTPTQPQAVEVSISTDYLEDVLSFLLTKQISFEMTYESMVVPAKPSEQHSDFAKEIPEKSIGVHSLALNSPKKTVMETIYQKYIRDNIEQTPLNETIIAEEYQLRVATFKRNFKARYGKSFYQLYMDKKMEYAKGLLLEGISASEISNRIGYTQPIKFNKIFQKYYGMTPKQYQKSQKE